jgi:hypothetical protein
MLLLQDAEETEMDEIIERLVVSIQQRQLVVFCGAGISMSLPSSVPSAALLTGQCVAAYNLRGLNPLPATATKSLEPLTEYLFANGLQPLFVRDLVPWRPFHRSPNVQHDTVADFLTCGAATYGVTTNFDQLVELSAGELGEDHFAAALDSQKANIATPHRPYLKLHGCACEPDSTLWCHSQLSPPAPVSPANQLIRDRLSSLRVWLEANLPEKTVLFVGFWTDWSYLGQVLADSVKSVHIPLVVLVDPQEEADLAMKAPELWNWSHENTEFKHVPVPGEVFLPKLREAFSKNLLGRVLREAAQGFGADRPGNVLPPVTFEGLTMDDLYSLRRDVYGVPVGHIPRFAQPDASMDAVGRAHLLLRHQGATADGSRYVLKDGQRVRVVNGRTRLVNQVKSEFYKEMPFLGGIEDDIVICAGGSDDGGTHLNIAKGSSTPTVVRPMSAAKWITLETALATVLA